MTPLIRIEQGDVRAVAAAWMRERPGGFRLLYCDPPFFTGRDRVADAGAYPDSGRTLEEYLAWMAQVLAAQAPLLAPDGFFCLHADYHSGHYLKVLGDRIFGYRNFRNEIIWHYTGRRMAGRRRVNQKHDALYIWARSPAARMRPLFEPAWTRHEYVRMKRQAVHRDADRREWIWGHAGRGRSKAYRIYLDEAVARGRAVDSVWDLPILNTSARERTGYPTQKPEALLERLVDLLSDPGDLVGDLMAGSGTLAAAAARRGRSAWVSDLNPAAVAVMRARLRPLAAAGGLGWEDRTRPQAEPSGS
ncbi:N6_N4_Mtase domain-containing protein [Candidatus Hydrogenisulfobacillus filiaventi]|uniref:N6_N4_Mtase domain-containing protein n=1 Tax=Candidatus Hydrogenisulfobacillus filiaventi TaxID=2707344 RepID=A0A6F8ZJY0_9FIRM|nr:N6_N4_Mtase domain-containing protein [Candidatus Hydrogenisulfobacillus filiaventi]